MDKQQILSTLRANKPDFIPLPEIDAPVIDPAEVEARFRGVLVEIGAKVVDATRDSVVDALKTVHPSFEPVFTKDLAGKEDLSDMDLFVCEGVLGVAENGAIWMPERTAVRRVAPFITQHLAIVLSRHQIVGNMHDAYAKINVDQDGFGVFIAGPSKTADIEQSLVHGAHGPRSLVVVLVD